ncbi:MAG: DUF6770 family protein [Bacteroidota bacterium]
MEKKVFSFLIILLTCSFPATLQAQEVMIEGISGQQFHGVQPIDGKGYYTFYRKEKGLKIKSNFHLKIYDLDLRQLSESTIELSRKAALKGGTFNGSNFLFSFIDPKSRKVTYKSFDENGQTGDKELKEKIKRNFLKQKRFHPSVFPSGNSGFYILDYTKGKKIGYRVRKVDNNLNLIWEEKFNPEKGQAQVLHVESSDENVLLVVQVREKSSLKDPIETIVVLDGQTGKQRFSFPLKQENIKLMPSAYLLQDNNTFICAGMYAPIEAASENEDGLFFMELDQSGKKTAFRQATWVGDLKTSIEKHAFGTAWWSTNPKIFFQEIRQYEDGYQFIGETFRRATSGTAIVSHMVENSGPGASLAVLDFIVFNVDKNLEVFEKIQFIPKEKMTVWIPTVDDYSLPLDSYFKNYNLLSFRFTENWDDELNAVIFYNWGRGRPYVGYAPLTDAIRINPKKIYLSKAAANFGTANVIKSKKDQVLIYEHNKKTKTLKLWIETLE